MKSRNVKVIDEHNIDRNASIMFALDLEGSEYVVYSIDRDETSSNIFVSKVLKNIDGTYNMLNIDDDDKKKEFSEIVKTLISTAVSDQNDKLVGTTTTLSNGKVIRFVDVLFNKEQHINVPKTYISTVKKEVTKVAENYYDVVVEETKVEAVLPSVNPVVEPVATVFPEPVVSTVVSEPVAPVAPAPVVTPVVAAPVTPAPTVVVAPQVEVAPVASVVAPVQQEVKPVVSEVVTPTIPQPAPAVVEAITVTPQPVAPVPTVPTPAPAVAENVAPSVVLPTPVVPEPVVTPVVEANQPLVFNAAKETNLNAALGEVANSTTIPVENIQPVREFGVDEPTAPVVQQPTVAPMVQPEVSTDAKVLSKKAGFANSKFFMVVAIAFFLSSCIFLGYEVYNYFQLVK